NATAPSRHGTHHNPPMLSGDREGAARRPVRSAPPVMTWLTGDGKGCSHLDQTWVQFTGRTLKEQLEWGWLDSVHPDDAENCLRTYEGAFEARKPFVMEYRLRRYDGEYRWVQSIGQPRYRDH